jgi:hypothetical protein
MGHGLRRPQKLSLLSIWLLLAVAVAVMDVVEAVVLVGT